MKCIDLEKCITLRLLFISIFCLNSLIICSTSNDSLKLDFLKANESYQSSNYYEAIDLYEQILDEGVHSEELYFNLGNCYYRIGNIPKSVLNFEKALKLAPSNAEFRKALDIVNKEVESEVFQVEDFILARAWVSFSQLCSPVIWLLIQAIIGLAILIILFDWQIGSNKLGSIKSMVLLFVCVALFIISFLAFAKSETIVHGQDSGILMNASELLSAPDKRADVLIELAPGEKVEILDELDGWYKVELMNKSVGWLETEFIEPI